MADTYQALIETAVIDVVLSREGKRRYSNGDPLTLDPSDLRDIVRLTMAKCAALASRPAEVDDKPVAYAVVSKKGGIHKLCITRPSAERKAAVWREEWPDNGCTVRPLAFGDSATTNKEK